MGHVKLFGIKSDFLVRFRTSGMFGPLQIKGQ